MVASSHPPTDPPTDPARAAHPAPAVDAPGPSAACASSGASASFPPPVPSSSAQGLHAPAVAAADWPVPVAASPVPLPWPLPLPWADALGATLHLWHDGHAEVRLAVQDAQLNSWQVAHGGVLMSLFDIAMAQAARSRHPHSAGVVTLEMKSSFLQAARGRLRVQARVLHATATLDFCEARLCDADGRLCASASGTFQHLRALPPRRQRPGAGPS